VLGPVVHNQQLDGLFQREDQPGPFMSPQFHRAASESLLAKEQFFKVGRPGDPDHVQVEVPRRNPRGVFSDTVTLARSF
jgi:hypothetical protein